MKQMELKENEKEAMGICENFVMKIRGAFKNKSEKDELTLAQFEEAMVYDRPFIVHI